ncbi:MAG: hypothetical protein K2Q12_07280 [Rickettsiales bacterium]|nr:hypothetical protein [Rickettsiales bacterium]
MVMNPLHDPQFINVPAFGSTIHCFAMGQSLASGLVTSQQTGLPVGRDIFIATLKALGVTASLTGAANGGSYAALTSADVDVWGTTSAASPFVTVSGSPVVTVTSANHNTRVGALINITGGAAVGGITLSGNYRVTAIVNSNSFRITHSSNASSAATGGGSPTITLYNPEFWWNNADNTPGPMLLDAYAIIDASGRVPSFVIWAQGEADSFQMPVPTTAAEHKRCCKAIFDALRSRYGAQLQVCIQGSPARRSSFNKNPNYQLIRENNNALVAENPDWIFIGGNTFTGSLFDSVHPNDEGYLSAGKGNALAVAKRLGVISGGHRGPVLASAAKVANTIELTFTHDAGTDFDKSTYNATGGLANYMTVIEAGAILTPASVTHTGTDKIIYTPTTTLAFDSEVYFGYDAMLSPDFSQPLDVATIPFDNAVFPQPVAPQRISLPIAAFSPLLIPNLHAWFDASDAATITASGGLVSQWNDKSGNARHATAAGAARPAIQSAVINGLDSLYSDGASGVGMTFPHALTNTSNITAFLVFRANPIADPTSSTQNGLTAISSINGVTNCYIGFRQTSNSHGVVQGLVGGTGLTLGNGSSYTNARVYSGRIGASNAAAWHNGTQRFNVARGGGPFTVNSTGSIFNEAPINAARAAVGWIPEVLYFARELSDIERRQVEAYLINKWGVV